MGEDGKRKGGIAEAIRLKVVDPLSDFASKIQSTLMNFIKKDMVEPLKNAISPIGKDIKIAVGATFNTVGKFINKIFETSLGKPLDMLIKEKGEYPIFLIDDISSYFDSVRKESIINYFKGRDVQLFLSSTDDLGIESKNFNIYEGDIIEPRDS
jgi:hypothetical protein